MESSKINDIIALISQLNVMELVELTKAMEKKFEVSGVMSGSTNNKQQSVTTDNLVEKEKTEFNVILKNFGTNKIAVIKEIKTILGLNLKDSKSFVESLPSLVKEKVSKEDSELLKKQLEEVGAIVEVN